MHYMFRGSIKDMYSQTTEANSFKIYSSSLGADPGFFLGGSASLRNSVTEWRHKQILIQNTGCIRKLQVMSGGRGYTPLHPPPWSTPIPQKLDSLFSWKSHNLITCSEQHLQPNYLWKCGEQLNCLITKLAWQNNHQIWIWTTYLSVSINLC